MELVLGLATLATAVSGMAGAGHYDDAPEITEAEPTTVQTTETIHQQVIPEIKDIPESHLIDFDRIGRIIDDSSIDPDLIKDSGDNDTFEKANDFDDLNNKFYFYEYGGPENHTSTAYGNLSSSSDVDCYKFTLYGKADVTMTFNNSANHNYQIELHKKLEVIDVKKKDALHTELVQSNWDPEPVIDEFLNAGVYFIKVSSPDGQYDSNHYGIDLEVKYRAEDLDIDVLEDQGAKAALWLCDYDPYGIRPTEGFNKKKILGGYQHVAVMAFWQHDDNYFNPIFPINPYSSYKQAELFIWDTEYRDALREYVGGFRKKVSDYFENHAKKEALSIQAEKAASGLSLALSLYSLGSNKLFEWACDIYGLSCDLTNVLFPSTYVYDNNWKLLQYLEGIYHALDRTSDTGDREVVRIPIWYEVSTPDKGEFHDEVFYTYTNYWYYFNYCPVPQDSYLYDRDEHNNTLYAHDFEGQNPINGTFFPIGGKNDLPNALNRREASAEPISKPLSLNETDEVYLWYDEYKWYSFTAPLDGNNTYRFESTGNGGTTCDVMDALVYSNSDKHKLEYVTQTDGIYNGDFAYEFNLNKDETVYFRVHGQVFDYHSLYGWSYEPVEDSTVRVVLPRVSTLVINGSQLGLGDDYEDGVYTTDFMRRNNITISKLGVKKNDEDKIMMHVDMDGDYPVTFFKIDFHRYIKTFSFDAYKDPMRNECCLFLDTQDLDGDPMYNDTIYGVDTYIENTKTFSFDFEHEHVSSVKLMFDPANDPISFWQRMETIYLDHFVVEFMD